MSFETKLQSIITKIRIDIRKLQGDLDAVVASNGTAALSSETSAGVIEVATQDETNAGTDNSRAVTPLKFHTRLTAFAQPLSSNLTTLAGVASGVTGRALLGAASVAAAKTTLALVKGDVGLGNVDNTSDINKPVSTAQQTALNLKADTTALPTKTSLGLDQVDNTSDVAKPVSTAQQTALNAKANLASPTLTGIPVAPTAASGTNTTQIATTAFATSAASSVTKASVGLGNVDNTSDASKPVSSAQQTALNLKANLSSPSLTGTPTAPTAASGTATTQLATTAFVATATSSALTSVPAASETVSGTVELATQSETDAGIDTVRAVTPAKFQTRLTAFAQPLNANLTTLADIVSGVTGRSLLAATTAAAAKTTLALVKADVGLSNVDNTADTAKPVSTAQQTALNAKANLASPALTGTPTAPTPASGTNTTQVATTEFVQTAVTASTAGTPTLLDGGAP